MNSLHRRHFLRGIGAGIALPTLHSLIPSRALAEAAKAAEAGKAGLTASGMPMRMAFLYHPNGVNPDKWKLTGTGKEYQFNETQKPFAKFKNDFQIYTGLEHKNGTAGGDGGGDHARANATFLTGVRPFKTAGADIKLGISVDQVAANAVGDQTRFSSLELSCDGVRKSGVCDSGYSCAYQFNLSWRSDTTPMTPESNPRLVFERLFGAGSKEERARGYQMRQQRQRSILDFIMEDANTLEKQLGNNDRLKLDEYLTGVREIEQRIEKAERFGVPADPGVAAPDGTPDNYEEHIRLMMDMLVMAFETDSTRVASFLLAHDGSNRSFKEIGVPDGHHTISHHQNEAENLAKLAKIDLFYSRQFAYFLEKLNEKKDADGKSILHNSMIVWGGGLFDPNRHQHNQLPIVLAGHAGGGRFQNGRHNDLGSDTPMSNLYLSLLDTMGVKQDSFGDSTGPMKTI
ncbi:MAG: DUF1552 domain-containing protein [Verrucomicrobiae bacterium]|nr:DUF1552 domain-containing protein [Verrucomicrobiae bacterium]